MIQRFREEQQGHRGTGGGSHYHAKQVPMSDLVPMLHIQISPFGMRGKETFVLYKTVQILFTETSPHFPHVECFIVT